MKLRHKSHLLIIISALIVVLVFAAMSLLSYRSYSLNALQRQAQMGAEMVRLTVTHEMIEGSPDHKGPFMSNLLDIPGLEGARIVPSQEVIEQMGVDISARLKVTDAEKQVLATGKEQKQLITGDRDRFIYSIPYIASSHGNTNCLNCHDGAEGDVLGVVSLEMDVTQQYNEAIRNTAGIALLFVLFAGFLAFALRRFLSPIEHATEELHHTVSLAEEGDFSGRMQRRSSDEIGDIALRTNHFMEVLDNSIGSITKDLDTLTGHRQVAERENLLLTTVSVVHTMALVAQFKQIIENDRTLEDVYSRFQELLEHQLHFKRYSFYEMNGSKNQMTLIFNGGLDGERELWCSSDILVNCEFCRAKRTAQLTKSVDAKNICPSFDGNRAGQEAELYHLCIPMMLSGSVGGVLQLVYDESEEQMVSTELPVVQSFMDEAAPVIEAKRLMQSLRDASMRDPMTNLYNRRYLEESLETLTSGVRRRDSQIGVVMCDIDFFKMVNDTYGHEVGDDVLKGTCNIITQTLRNADVVIRYGGEEFLVLLMDASEEGALMVADRIRTQLEAHKFKTSDGPMTKTMSLGVSMFPEDDDDFWACAKYADVALYQAKDTGRNKVIRYQDGMTSED